MEKRKRWLPLAVALLAAAGAHLVFALLSGKWLFQENPYNSYLLQVQSWLQGRLDVDQRPWLELAWYGGKWYVSFPPFPSYLLLPLVAIFGERAPDALLAFLSMLCGTGAAVRLARQRHIRPALSVFLALFLVLGGNLWMVTVDAWVWFFAQNLSFTLTLAAFAAAGEGRRGLACFFLCAAVGCRPFQILWFPAVLWLLTEKEQEGKGRLRRLVERPWVYVPAALLALSFMGLNVARFGNPVEFGHNYLPEFVRSQEGQFSFSYLWGNLAGLLRMPTRGEDGLWSFYNYNGCNLFLVWPMLLWYLPEVLRGLAANLRARKFRQMLPGLGCLLLALLHIVLLCLHKTMGGAHFGNRYLSDLMPGVYLGLCAALGKRGEDAPIRPWELAGAGVLFCWGLLLNFSGVLGFYRDLM